MEQENKMFCLSIEQLAAAKKVRGRELKELGLDSRGIIHRLSQVIPDKFKLL